MKIEDFFKNIATPGISVITAVMVGVLNYQVSQTDLKLKLRDQELKERLSEIDLLVKQNKEEREERESNQDFNLKIYEIVTKSLEESNAQKQEAAKAFVVVMVEEPLRSSLLNVLKLGGSPEIRKNISKILEAEERFQTSIASRVEKKREDVSSHNWANWDFDIFWCSSSGGSAKREAQAIGEQLVAEGAEGRIRVRELPDTINAKSGYQIDGYAIRRNSNEEKMANALQKLAESTLQSDSGKVSFRQSLTRQNTPWYISAFVCPNN